MQPGEVIVAGAGPGGLVTALALHARGIVCTVYEASEELRPLGVGINLLPHAVRVLAELGVAERLAPVAVETSELVYYNRHGQRIWSEPRGRAAGYDVPQFSLHRGILQTMLLAEARERLGAERVMLGHALASFDATAGGVVATFTRRSDGSAVDVEAAALVAADGIHSTARRQLHPHEGAPRYAGRMLWRAVTPAEPFLSGSTMIMAGHQDRKFVCYPITRPDANGRQLVNWIAELPVAGETPPRQDWSRVVEPSLFRDAFAAWRFDWLDVPALIDGAGAVYEYPLADRDPLDHWGLGAVTLLGDAAHPMYPIGSNGASQAILDANVLARELAGHRTAGEGFAAYESARREATARIVLLNRQNGPEQVMQLAEERAPDGFADVHDVIERGELEAIAARYKQIAGFAPEQVNQARGPR